MDMKQYWIVGSIVLVIIFIVLFMTYERGAQVKNVPPKNDTVVIFGDSLAEGVGATDGHDLSQVLSQSIGKKFINHGKRGDTTRSALARIPEVIIDDPGVVVIILGGNDVLQKLPKEETFANLKKMITIFQEHGAAVVVIGVRSGVVGDGRGEDYEKVARETGSLYMSDILQDVFGKKQFMSDTVHPNDAGYAVIAQRMSSVIRKIFVQ